MRNARAEARGVARAARDLLRFDGVTAGEATWKTGASRPVPVTRAYPLADTPVPATHFLSNGSYSVMVTSSAASISDPGRSG